MATEAWPGVWSSLLSDVINGSDRPQQKQAEVKRSYKHGCAYTPWSSLCTPSKVATSLDAAVRSLGPKQDPQSEVAAMRHPAAQGRQRSVRAPRARPVCTHRSHRPWSGCETVVDKRCCRSPKEAKPADSLGNQTSGTRCTDCFPFASGRTATGRQAPQDAHGAPSPATQCSGEAPHRHVRLVFRCEHSHSASGFTDGPAGPQELCTSQSHHVVK